EGERAPGIEPRGTHRLRARHRDGRMIAARHPREARRLRGARRVEDLRPIDFLLPRADARRDLLDRGKSGTEGRDGGHHAELTARPPTVKRKRTPRAIFPPTPSAARPRVPAGSAESPVPCSGVAGAG